MQFQKNNLDKYKNTKRAKRNSNPDYNQDQEYEVEKILKEKKKRRKNPKTGKIEYIKEYLVKWIGYDDPSWEPEQNLDNCKELLSEFIVKNLKKLSQSSRKEKAPSGLLRKAKRRQRIVSCLHIRMQQKEPSPCCTI